VGKWRKTKKKLYTLPKAKPPLNRKGNKKLSKKNNQRHPISKR
jgi:hypothetical protein